jgi:hypothetical protein
VDSVTECRLVHAIELQLRAPTVRDACLLGILDNRIKFALGVVYLHPNTPNSEAERCLFQALMQYSDSIKKIIPDYDPDTDISIVLTGDFNIDVQGNQSLLHFMKCEFRLEYVPMKPTTLGNTTIDLTFVPNIIRLLFLLPQTFAKQNCHRLLGIIIHKFITFLTFILLLPRKD